MNNLVALRRIVSQLAADGIRTWVFGGWAEELRGLAPSRSHGDIDLLYQGTDFRAVDKFIVRRHLQAIPAKRLGHKRAFIIDDIVVELFLVRTDDNRTPHTIFWDWFRWDWPSDTFGFVDHVPVAGATALRRYRADFTVIRNAARYSATPSIYDAAALHKGH
jgi:hypothetical protein